MKTCLVLGSKLDVVYSESVHFTPFALVSNVTISALISTVSKSPISTTRPMETTMAMNV